MRGLVKTLDSNDPTNKCKIIFRQARFLVFKAPIIIEVALS